MEYFAGAMIGGAIAGLPFAMEGFNVGGLIACLFSKIFVILIFVSIALTLSVVGKQKLWISILGSFAGGVLFAVGLGTVSSLLLMKTDLI